MSTVKIEQPPFAVNYRTSRNETSFAIKRNRSTRSKRIMGIEVLVNQQRLRALADLYQI
jgi:hypothetical protein